MDRGASRAQVFCLCKYDKVEQKSYQYINGDDDYICRGSAFISPDNFKWRFGGWEEKND